MRTVYKKVLFSLVLTFILSELTLRIYSQVHPSIIAYNPSRYRKFKARPGDLSYGFPINSNGFKDQPFSKTRLPNEYRVAAIGDSFVFSVVPYEASFCTLLEKRFRNVNVMNFGVIGTKPEDYATVLMNDAIPYAPDTVIVFIYVGNDFLPSRRLWYDYSALATVIHHSIKAFRVYNGQDIHQNYKYDDNMTPLSYADFLATEAKYAETYYSEADRFKREFDLAMSSIYAIQDICKKHRIQLRVVALPDRLQIEPSLQTNIAQYLKIPLSSFDFLRPQKLLTETLGAKDIPFLDLLKPFANDSKKKYINHDIHLNIHGNELVSELIPDDWFRGTK
jgi:hypothetical protein